MRKVIDSNCLQSEELRSYLAASSSNYAVLTEYAAMEAYKGNTLISIQKSMDIVSEYPEQIIVLKGTRAISSLRGKSRGLQNRIIDQVQTREFSKFVKTLRSARRGDRAAEKHLLKHGRNADKHLQGMLDDASDRGTNISMFFNLYSKEERRSLSAGPPYSSELVDKITKNVLYIAGRLFQEHPDEPEWPTRTELPYTYIFRSSLCIYLLVLDWITLGGFQGASSETHRNDFVDMTFAAYGTYFDGLMTSDSKPARIHRQARQWLTEIFGCEIPRHPGNQA
jgi:hypothetical protein